MWRERRIPRFLYLYRTYLDVFGHTSKQVIFPPAQDSRLFNEGALSWRPPPRTSAPSWLAFSLFSFSVGPSRACWESLGSTPALATSGQGQPWPISRGADVRSPEERRETRHISFPPPKDRGGRRQLSPDSSDGETEARTCRDLTRATNHWVKKLTPEPLASAAPLLLSWSSTPAEHPTPNHHALDAPTDKTHLPWMPAKTQRRL